MFTKKNMLMAGAVSTVALLFAVLGLVGPQSAAFAADEADTPKIECDGKKGPDGKGKRGCRKGNKDKDEDAAHEEGAEQPATSPAEDSSTPADTEA